MTSVEIFKQRLIGKPHDAIIDELMSVIYTNKEIANVIVNEFCSLIPRKLDESLLHQAISRGNANVFMVLLDNFIIIKLPSTRRSLQKIRRGAAFVSRRKDIPTNYIIKYFTLYSNELQQVHIPYYACLSRFMIGLEAISDITNLPLEELIPAFPTNRRDIECLGVIIMKRINEIKKRHINIFIQSLVMKSRYLTMQYCSMLIVCIDKYPDVYGYLINYKINSNSPAHALKMLNYAISRCDANTLNRIPPKTIINYKHYIALVNACMDINLLIKPTIEYIWNVVNDEAKLIAAHMHSRGYSLFGKIDIGYLNRKKIRTKMNYIEVAEYASRYDKFAAEYLSSSHCRSVVLCALSGREINQHHRDIALLVKNSYH